MGQAERAPRLESDCVVSRRDVVGYEPHPFAGRLYQGYRAKTLALGRRKSRMS